ncbi:Aste57867_25011 [Aphanomyces stellatus]|uniref:Aste57867_25011 protein n=1 Tax=Aphanomyces stellatus TaxID=120398 RepID=A0A485LS07_9STRA|nr:hypothetical protein As57867_024933 [Aphanomyces stellatus]VFU01642.1 Aste57867_25011 [Aphanomyces stellatus]
MLRAVRRLGGRGRAMGTHSVPSGVVPPTTSPTEWTSRSFTQYLTSSTPRFIAHMHEKINALQPPTQTSTPCYLRFLEKMQIKHASAWALDSVHYQCDPSTTEFAQLTSRVLPNMGAVLVSSGPSHTMVFQLDAPIPVANNDVNLVQISSSIDGDSTRGLTAATILAPFDVVEMIKAQSHPLAWETESFANMARLSLDSHCCVYFRGPPVSP